MIYSFLDLRTAGIIAGLLLVLGHGWALFRAPQVRDSLAKFPRSDFSGVVLLTVAAGWAFALIATMDLGEFSHLRRMILLAIPVAYVLTLKFVDEFLAVRALGIVMLLAAEPLIEAAFLKPPASRLLLVILAYVWATLGMFYVGMPYLLRDHVAWLRQSDARWKAACFGGIGYGLALLACALAFY